MATIGSSRMGVGGSFCLWCWRSPPCGVRHWASLAFKTATHGNLPLQSVAVLVGLYSSLRCSSFFDLVLILRAISCNEHKGTYVHRQAFEATVANRLALSVYKSKLNYCASRDVLRDVTRFVFVVNTKSCVYVAEICEREPTFLRASLRVHHLHVHQSARAPPWLFCRRAEPKLNHCA